MVEFDDVSVVIPTVRESLVTPATVPDDAEVIVRRDEGLNVARNAGVRAASADWIVIADDDIEFPTATVAETLGRMDRQTLAGLRDFPPLRWVIGRLMIFHRDLWNRVGGFDERRHHGGDTDFAIRVEKEGGRVLQLERDVVPHYDEETGDTMVTRGHLEWTWYLLRRHPRVFGPVAAKLLANKLRPR
ncbi:glycosyltransferase family 2 protein [Halococcoides cellulosivorans]|uniref:Glycosyl transferase n=1 Tax=Halococcoides cellulosivorans TaxID=1679096 RepID=A0A2R4WXZ9_9EURY|nr:glycosyltransferase [Halococcoides cellulosivorans]AWB26414.1 glycosyl transferase [Halococcoides cellulosivorans]